MLIRCQECKKPVAEIVDGELVIKIRHSGERHEAKIRLWDAGKGSEPKSANEIKIFVDEEAVEMLYAVPV